MTDGTEARISPATARPLLLGALAALSAGAAAIHFAVMFEHFGEYSLYGVFFLVLAWAQLVWPVVLIALPFLTWAPARARPARFPAGWSPSGLTPLAARRAGRLAVAGRHRERRCPGDLLRLAFHRAAPRPGHQDGGGLGRPRPGVRDRGDPAGRHRGRDPGPPGLLARTVRPRSQARSLASLLAAPVVVIAATAAVMTPAWAGSEGPAGMASGSSGSMASSADSLQGGMGDMGSTNGLPEMQMYGSTNAPTAAQVEAAANLIKETDASLVRFENVNNAIAAGYTYRLATNGEEHLLYDGGNPAYQGLNPQDPSSLVYATNVKGHAPILLGAMYLMPGARTGRRSAAG